MQVIIEISEERYKDAQAIAKLQKNSKMQTCEKIIAAGTPLSEHGRLIDADAIIEDWKEGFHRNMVCALMDGAPTIIPATKEGE